MANETVFSTVFEKEVNHVGYIQISEHSWDIEPGHS